MQAPAISLLFCPIPHDSMTDIHNLTHADLDWQQLWQNARRQKGWAGKGSAEWDKKAPSFAARNRTSPFIDLLLTHLPATPAMTILDVGCGPGNLAIPLAGRCRSVTALDFSAKMLEILTTEAQALDITNITARRCAWEDDWHTLGIVPHDIAIASRSLSVDDLPAAIAKLNHFARRYVFIADRITPTPFAPEAFAAVGRPFASGPDYIYTLNILYSMGIHPNVTILQPESDFRFQDLDQAFLTYSWMIKDLSDTEELLLKQFLQQQSRPNSDGTISIPRQHPLRWALIWWEKAAETATHRQRNTPEKSL